MSECLQHLTVSKDVAASRGTTLLNASVSAMAPFGFAPQSRVQTPSGPATVMGVDAKGHLRFRLDNHHNDGEELVCWEALKSQRALASAGFRSLTPEKDEAFFSVAVVYTDADSKEDVFVDVRPEATRPLGFLPGDHIRTPFTFATVVGVDMKGVMYVRNDADDSGCVTWTETVSHNHSKASYTREGYRLANASDKDFLDHAVARRDTDGNTILLDPRAQATAKKFPGFPPGCRVMTGDDGVGVVVGVDVDGELFFCHDGTDNDSVTFYRDCRCEKDLLGNGFRRMTVLEERFHAIATIHKFHKKDAKVFIDTRPDSVEAACGFRPGDHIKTSDTFATVVGIDMDGCLQVRNDGDPTDDTISSTFLSNKEEVAQAGFRLVDLTTGNDKEFLANAKPMRDEKGYRILVDRRYHVSQRLFSLRPGTQVITPRGQLVAVVGVDVNGSLRFEVRVRVNDDYDESYIMLDERCTSKQQFQQLEYRSATSKKDEDFFAASQLIYLNRKNPASAMLIDERQDACKAFGFIPGDQIRTPDTFATVVGINVNGCLIITNAKCAGDIFSETSLTLKKMLSRTYDTSRGYRHIHGGDKDFLRVSDGFDDIHGTAILIDSRPQTMRARFDLPTSRNKLLFSASGVFVTTVGVDVNGELRFVQDGHDEPELELISDPIQCKCRGDFERHKIRLVTKEDEAFFSVAVPHTHTLPGEKRVTQRLRIDVRPEATERFGFVSGDRILVGGGGPHGTVLGANVNGTMVIRIDGDRHFSAWENYKSPEDYACEGFRHVAEKDIAFKSKAVRFASHEIGAATGVAAAPPTFLDVRAEALEPFEEFGFCVGERIWTRNGFATIRGVDVNGTLYFEWDHTKGVVSCRDMLKTQRNLGLRKLNEKEEAFLSIAQPYPLVDMGDTIIDCLQVSHVFLDTRRRAHTQIKDNSLKEDVLSSEDFRPGDMVVTNHGLSTVVGQCIFGNVYLRQCVCTSSVKKPQNITNLTVGGGGSGADAGIVCEGPPRPLKKTTGWRLATDAEKDFLKHASMHATTNRLPIQLDTRADVVHRAHGVRPQECVQTVHGFARVVGVCVLGRLFLSVEGFPNETLFPQEAAVKGSAATAVLKLNDAKRRFLAAASLHEIYQSTAKIFLDTRPEATRAFGYLPGERAVPKGSAVAAPEAYVVGVDVDGTLFFSCPSYGGKVFYAKAPADPTKSIVYQHPMHHLTSLEEKPPILVPLPIPPERLVPRGQGLTAAKDPTTSKAKHQQTQQTVTLPCGSRYVGGFSKAGLRHGRGLLRGADGSWQYKGQWQRGLPHGTGTMRVGVGRRGAEDVYEGQWACGVPHGPGTLATRDGRRYRGKWQHGRRVIGGTEMMAVRVSGGEAIRPKPKARKGKSKGSRPNGGAALPVVLCAHAEAQRMIVVVGTTLRRSKDALVSAQGMYPIPAHVLKVRVCKKPAEPSLPKPRATLRSFLLANI